MMSRKNKNFELTNDVEGLGKSYIGLKILGRVILSCQFKSGPGHQLTPKFNYGLALKTKPGADLTPPGIFPFWFNSNSLTSPTADSKRQETSASDASMMRARFLGMGVFRG